MGEVGAWLQAAAEKLDKAGVDVPGLGRITAKDITLGDVGAVLENMSYGFYPTRTGEPSTRLTPQALELLNLSVVGGAASGAVRAARAAPKAAAAVAGAAALAPAEAKGATDGR
jgi:hypothetical protein